MRATRQRNTKAELDLQAALDQIGLQYTVDRSPLPQLRCRADILFASERVAVFVDGCFWHGCPDHGTWPKQNGTWWRTKILKNRSRDADTDYHLQQVGWLALRVWEHDDASQAARRILEVLDHRRERV
jgi:DNA mismatch endonuclease, patch repair protein